MRKNLTVLSVDCVASVVWSPVGWGCNSEVYVQKAGLRVGCKEVLTD